MKKALILLAVLSFSGCTTSQKIWFYETTGRAADEQAFEEELNRPEPLIEAKF